jgi:8-oxo-dGTP pyrophosphatase MutT (NUDIX family)
MGSQPAKPRAAATVILLRRGEKHVDSGVEVLLARRNPRARFMPGVWVFPGGAVAAADGADPSLPAAEVPDSAYRAAAIRELAEEAGISLPDSAELVPYSRWITPEPVPVRFDTRFYVALAPAHSRPTPDGAETVAADWFGPGGALELHAAGELGLVFPTIKHLESLDGYADAEEVLAAARRSTVEPVLPHVVSEGGERRIVLPGEPGYGL